MGWSPGGTEEIFTHEDLINKFDVKGISKSPAIFDIEKLNWMNAEHIKRMADEEFYNISKDYIKKGVKSSNIDLIKISKILKPRTITLNDIVSMVDFFDNLPDYSTELFLHKKMKTNKENSLVSLKAAKELFQKLENWNEEEIHNRLFELIGNLGIKNGQMLWP